MKVLSIGSDRLLFEPGSEVRERLARQSEKYDRLTIIVFAKKPLGYRVFALTPTTLVIPTNSLSRINYIFDAIKIGKKIPAPDLVTAQDPFEAGIVGRVLASYHRVKLELQIHTDLFSPYFAKQSVLNRLRVLIAKFLLPSADHVRVVSQRIADSLKARKVILKSPPEIRPVKVELEKLRLMPITIDLHQKYPQFKKIILMASRLTWEKNIDLAIKAMSEVVKREPKIGLVIVGSGPKKNSLQRLVSSLGLSDNIVFEGWINDLATYYKTSDLFLNTSYYEGYGLTLLEAKTCGLPVISTDVGAAREIGVIIAKEDDLVQSILRQLT